MGRAIILVADGFGIGSAPDAESFSDVGANTFGHIAASYRELKGSQLDLPNLANLGLIKACNAVSPEPIDAAPAQSIQGAYGAAAQISTGKDTPSGHWEMTGAPVLFDWGYYPDIDSCFPEDMLRELQSMTGVPGFLGLCHASGTDIIRDLGEEHMRSGMPICYTSADSVFQIAAHETSFGLDNLYALCEAAREILMDANIGRVIARPFIGNDADSFERTGNRRDFSIEPPSPTLLDDLVAQGHNVAAIGKISDIFAHRGISKNTKATGLNALIDTCLQHLKSEPDGSLIFTNLVNFDQDFGHRRDPLGYAEALQYFDDRLPEITNAMRGDDLLIITADHGCDPTWHGNDHTREYVPVLCYQHNLADVDLGQRKTFADIGQTLASFFDLPPLPYGESFMEALSKGTLSADIND